MNKEVQRDRITIFLAIISAGVNFIPISKSWIISIGIFLIAALVYIFYPLIYQLFHRETPRWNWDSLIPKSTTSKILLLIAVLIIILGIIYALGHQENTLESNPTPTPTTSPTITEPSIQESHPNPDEIFNAIDQEPAYLQDEARQSYNGIQVTWIVSLFSMTNTSDGERISATSVDNSLDLVIFTINLDDYPQLKIMEPHQEFVVQGAITSVDPIGIINLGDCHLTFPW